MKSNRMFVRRNLAQHRHYSVLAPHLPSMDLDPKGDKFLILLAREIASLVEDDITVMHMGTLYQTVLLDPALAQAQDGSLRLRRKNVSGQFVYTTLLADTFVAVPVMWKPTLEACGVPDLTQDRWVRIKTKHPLVKYSK